MTALERLVIAWWKDTLVFGRTAQVRLLVHPFYFLPQDFGVLYKYGISRKGYGVKCQIVAVST